MHEGVANIHAMTALVDHYDSNSHSPYDYYHHQPSCQVCEDVLKTQTNFLNAVQTLFLSNNHSNHDTKHSYINKHTIKKKKKTIENKKMERVYRIRDE
jgi:hypothetical protein